MEKTREELRADAARLEEQIEANLQSGTRSPETKKLMSALLAAAKAAGEIEFYALAASIVFLAAIISSPHPEYIGPASKELRAMASMAQVPNQDAFLHKKSEATPCP